MVLKQSFKYLKNEKINFIKVILKLDCLFFLNTSILSHLILYSKSYFDSNKSKKRSNTKNNLPNQAKKDFFESSTAMVCFKTLRFCLFIATPLNCRCLQVNRPPKSSKSSRRCATCAARRCTRWKR